jgi:transcriptional regulator with XRE-family HTH domain
VVRPPRDERGEASISSLTGEGELTHEFLLQVGARIRTLRSDRLLTVQQLADRSQISRRLLTQIELGQANPSLVAITRIARQLGTEFTTLLSTSHPKVPIEVHTAPHHVLVWRSERGSTAHLLEATDSRSADMWLWHLRPRDTYQGQADPARSQELFYVLAGTLTLRADDHALALPAGASGRLRSDRMYSYLNAGDVTVTFLRTVALTS